MLELPPRTTLLHTQPGTLGTTALALEQWPSLVEGRSGRRCAETSGPFILSVSDLPGDALAPGARPPQALRQLPWHCLPLPAPSPRPPRGKIRAHLPHRQPTARQSSREAVPLLRPLRLPLLQVPVHVPPVCVRHPGNGP